jgi:hypothetical protein
MGDLSFVCLSNGIALMDSNATEKAIKEGSLKGEVKKGDRSSSVWITRRR